MARFQRDCLQDKRFKSKKEDKQIIDGKLRRTESRGRACQLSVRLMDTLVSILEYHRCTRCRCSNAKFHTNNEKEKLSKKLKTDLFFILTRIFRENSLKDQQTMVAIPYPLCFHIYTATVTKSMFLSNGELTLR